MTLCPTLLVCVCVCVGGESVMVVVVGGFAELAEIDGSGIDMASAAQRFSEAYKGETLFWKKKYEALRISCH